jgi:hypothetical protein
MGAALALSAFVAAMLCVPSATGRVKPNLMVRADMGLPASVQSDQPFDLSIVIDNVGRAASPPSKVRATFSLDATKSQDDGRLGQTIVPRIGRRSSAVLSFGVAFPAGTPEGPYYVIVCADATKQVTESNEQDNCAVSATTVDVDDTAPVADITSPTPGSTTGSSGTIAYTLDPSTVVVICTLDGSEVACDLNGSYVFTGLADGIHNFVLNGFDAAQNVGTDELQWTVDATAG